MNNFLTLSRSKSRDRYSSFDLGDDMKQLLIDGTSCGKWQSERWCPATIDEAERVVQLFENKSISFTQNETVRTFQITESGRLDYLVDDVIKVKNLTFVEVRGHLFVPFFPS